MTRFNVTFFAFISLFFAVVQSAWGIEQCTMNNKSIDTSNGSELKGKSGVVRCRDSYSGQLSRELELQNGNFQGLVRKYRQGHLVEEFYVDERGRRQGVSRQWADNGQLIQELNFEEGKVKGLSKNWYENGQKKSVSYVDHNVSANVEWNEKGQLIALRCADHSVLKPAFNDLTACGLNGRESDVELFRTNGDLAQHVVYAKGQVHKQFVFNRDGALREQEVSEGNKKSTTRFDDKGDKAYFSESVKIGSRFLPLFEQKYASGGVLIYELKKQLDGDLIRTVYEKTFYMNGQPRHVAEFSSEGQNQFIKSTDFSDAGKVRVRRTQKVLGPYKVITIGKSEVFDEQGRLKTARFYGDDGTLMREQEFDISGSMVKDQAVFPDGSRNVQ